MEISEVRIKLTEESDDRLQAFCSITFDDCFVVRDLKVIEGSNGPFVAMPSRKLTSHCPRCGCKNHLRAGYCNQCGGRLNPDRACRDPEGRAKLYADIAHPINSKCREAIQDKVISAYRQELELAKQPGYVSRYDDEYDDDVIAEDLGVAAAAAPPPPEPPPSEMPPGEMPPGEPSRPTPARAAPEAPIQRTDEPAGVSEPRPPHVGSPPDEPPSPPEQTPRKRGFGAGILDE